ncbi:MAG: FAD-dependent oxidoreductase [Oscillospiraceae bacterium]|nr:FAD-dependent oxidoreductase [Oscillospiraceae bacterium]
MAQTYLQDYQRKYPHLFEPMQVGRVRFRNRIIAAPTHHSFAAAPDDRLSERGVRTYGERAFGGAAAVTIGEGKLDDLNSTAHTGHVDCFTAGAVQPLLWYSDYVHTCGALASIEFNHSGQFAQPEFNPKGLGPMGASACVMPNGLTCREMTEEDMELVADHYAHACLTAKRAGIDMVNLHLGHGWLLGGFLTPMFNRRKDQYGGSLENRVRFPRMVLERVRKAVGPDFLLEARLSGDEMTPDGLKIQDTIEIVKRLEDLLDLVHLSCGTRLDPVARCLIGADHFTEPGHNAHLSEAVKRSGVKLPVGVVGNITKPELAERILAEGQADYIVMARSLIADPNWANKVREGREEDIRPCIKCSRCGDMTKSVCSVNPLFGHVSTRRDFPPAVRRKKIAVVGGGVAGMQAALAAAERGHDCVLYERSGCLGGQLFYTDYVWFKREMRDYRDYLIRQISKAGVEVRLNTEAAPELVYPERPDGIIVAVGAEPFIPPIPGVEGGNVATALDVFGHEDRLPEHVVIIGGGLVGCELSLHLSRHGVRSTVVEMGPALAPESVMQERVRTLDLMEKDPNIESFTGLRCTEITGSGVTAVDGAGVSHVLAAPKVILASGMKPLAQLRDSFQGAARDVTAVGDCLKAGNIHHAVFTGYSAALMM